MLRVLLQAGWAQRPQISFCKNHVWYGNGISKCSFHIPGSGSLEALLFLNALIVYYSSSARYHRTELATSNKFLSATNARARKQISYGRILHFMHEYRLRMAQATVLRSCVRGKVLKTCVSISWVGWIPSTLEYCTISVLFIICHSLSSYSVLFQGFSA